MLFEPSPKAIVDVSINSKSLAPHGDDKTFMTPTWLDDNLPEKNLS